MSRRDADTLIAAVAALIGPAAAAQDRFGVAVSGGPDSLALLLLAQAAFGERMAAASVDHGLRESAAGECADVAALCAERGITHQILTADAPPDPPNQAGARTLRYALLNQWADAQGIDWLLTGHHADDQVETLVMRLNRQSGISGLSGIRARNGRVLRPLLGRSRADLHAITKSAGLVPVEDPANQDPRHDRSRVRAALAQGSLFDAGAVAQSVGRIADAEDALNWVTEQLLKDRILPDGDSFHFDVTDLPNELVQRVVARMVTPSTGSPPRGGDVARLVASLRAGETATLAGWRAAPDPRSPASWHFARAAPRRNHD